MKKRPSGKLPTTKDKSQPSEDLASKATNISLQLGLWDEYEASKNKKLERLFPEFEKRVAEIINGFVEPKQIAEDNKQEVIDRFRELKEKAHQGAPAIIRKFTNYQIARTLTSLLDEVDELTPGELEIILEYLMPPSLDYENILKQVDETVIQTKRDCIDYALKFGIMPPHAAYYDPTGWVSLVQKNPYKKIHDAAQDLVLNNHADFIEIALPKGAKKLIMSDLGPGTGDIAVIAIDTAMKVKEVLEMDLGMDYLMPDESIGMLFIAVTTLLEKYTNYLLMLTRNTKSNASQRPWLMPLIEILRNINKKKSQDEKLKISDKMVYLTNKLKKILENFIKQNNVKYKIHEPAEEFIEENTDVDLYIDREKLSSEEIEQRLNQTAELLKMSISRMLSMHKYDDFEDIVKIDNAELPLRIIPIQTTFDKLDFSDIQSSPEVGVLHQIYGNTVNNAEDPEEFLREIVAGKLLNEPTLDDEGNIEHANYCVIGLQIRQGRPDAGILKPYDTDLSRNFVGSLFLDPSIKYYDPNDSMRRIRELHEFIDIQFSFDYVHSNVSKMLRIEPRFITKKDIALNTSERWQDSDILEEGSDILLIPVYKQTMWQIEELFHRTDIQIVDYRQDKRHGTDVTHFLVRGKTEKEKEEYQEILRRRQRNQDRRANQKASSDS